MSPPIRRPPHPSRRGDPGRRRDLEVGGTIETLSLVIVGEGDVAYVPALRLACTAEVEENT
jgi:hypothetical protein